MDLKALEAFCAVVSAGSVTAAAKSLGRSQPVVSRLLQDLEQDLGYTLFERNGPRLIPTRQGLLLSADVERALTSVRAIRTRAAKIACGAGRPLRISAISALASGLLPRAVALCGEDLREDIGISTAPPDEVRNAVREKLADIGATSLPLDHQALNVHWIGSAPCILALPAKDRLAQEMHPVPLSMLNGRRLIMMLSGAPGLAARIRASMERANVTPERVIETNSSLNAMAFVREGAGLAIVEPVTAAGAPLEGVVTRPLAQAIPFYFGVISTEGALEPSALRMIDALLQAARQLLPQFCEHPPAHHADILGDLHQRDIA